MDARRARGTVISFIGKAIGSLTGANQQADAAQQASQTQAASSQAAIDAQTKQFNQIQQLLSPFVQAGTGALSGQQNLLGLNGSGAQQTAIDGIQNGSQFQSMLAQGNNSILQNASATGGLRGGNTQSALAQFSPQLLNSLIQQQYSNLGGLTSLGQNAAAGVGNAGMNTTNSISDLLKQQGAATAGGQLAQGGVAASGINSLAQLGGFIGTKNIGAGLNSVGSGLSSFASTLGSLLPF